MKKHILILSLFLSSWIVQGQVINISDPAFKAALIQRGVDLNGNNLIEQSEALATTGSLNLSFKPIEDMSGIEYFTNITGLICRACSLKTLDVSGCAKLQKIDLSFNVLTQLELGNNDNLDSLNCTANSLTSLNISGLPNLKQLSFSNNNITQIDLSSSSKLTTFDCSLNKITSLDLTVYPLLDIVNVTGNLITQITFGLNNVITSLNCARNLLTELDLRNFSGLSKLECDQNPNLTKICVTPAQLITATSVSPPWKKDATTAYNTTADCGLITSLEGENDATVKKHIVKIFNSLGKEVLMSHAIEGVFIYHYSDGSIKKFIK